MDWETVKCLEDLKYYHVRLARSAGHLVLRTESMTAPERKILRLERQQLADSTPRDLANFTSFPPRCLSEMPLFCCGKSHRSAQTWR